MNYFKSKIVNEAGEILTFIAPVFTMNESPRHLLYDRQDNNEIHGLPDDVDQEEVLSIQHAQCEVEVVDFADIEDVLKSCRLYKEINAQIESRIRKYYSVGDEFSLLKLETTDPKRIAYQQVVDDFREIGRLQKVALGLKQ